MKLYINKIFRASLILTLFSSISVLLSDKCGAQSMSSLLLNPDARAVSMANASVSDEASAWALQNNVAAMSLSDKKLDAAASFGLWQPSYASDKIVGASAMFRLKKLAFGAEFKYMAMPSYEATSGSGHQIRDGLFKPNEYSVGLGASYAIIDCLSAGVAVKLASSSLAPDVNGLAFACDIAAYFHKNGIQAGLSVNNLGTKVKYGENAYSIPAMAKLGAGYAKEFGISSISANVEADVLFNGGMMAGAGLEYGIKNMAFVRAGYHYGDAQKAIPSYASAGLGLNLWGVKLDCAYIFASKTLSNSLFISLGYSF